MRTQAQTQDAAERVASARPIAGNAIFYPAAAAYALFVAPASVLAMLGRLAVFPGLATAVGHAHEMLFGYALAVVAGNQLGPMSRSRIGALAALWLIARVTFVLAPQSIVAVAADIAFAALLALQIAPRLIGAAKKIRNQALPVVLVAVCAASIAFHVGAYGRSIESVHAVPLVGVVLFAMLMLFMGGRVIAPTVAGQFHRQGYTLQARVQPRIESALLATMSVAVAASAFASLPPFAALVAAAMASAGLLAAVRIARWRLWALRGRPDLICLAAGYAWLALGLVLYALALVTGRYETAALHVITVGSLGTLTINIMALTWTLKARLDPSRASLTVWATVLIAAATLARVLAAVDVDHRSAALLTGSVCWSIAFALLLVRFARVRKRQR